MNLYFFVVKFWFSIPTICSLIFLFHNAFEILVLLSRDFCQALYLVYTN